MNIPDSLVRDFVKIAKEPVKTGGDSTLYGTVVSVSGNGSQREAMVLIDGAEMATPASLGMDAEQGDRVSVLVKNHEAVINGNITSPASARTATRYMRFTEDGLKIGSFGSSGNPSGNYILITDNAYYIKASDDTVLLSVTSDGTRVYGTDGKLKASFLSGGTTLYSPGASPIPKLLMNASGVTIYDPTGTKTMAEFLSSGIKIYNENGVITSKFDATGAVLLNPTSNDNDGVRIYNGSQANAANLLASFVASGIRLHALVTSGGTTVNRTLAEFLASGISLYNQNGYRMFLADTSGIHLYDDTQTLSAEFLSTGLKLYGQRDGVKIYNSPVDTTPISEFGASGVKLHALVETQSGGVIQTTNRVLAEFLNTGVKLYNQSGILQTKVDTDGVKLYNKNGDLTASFEDSGLKLYGRGDGVRIYSDSVGNGSAAKLLFSIKSDGMRLHAIDNSGSTPVNKTVAEFLIGGITLKSPNGTNSIVIGDSDVTLYDQNGQNPLSIRAEISTLYNRDDNLRLEMMNNYALQTDLEDLEDTVSGKASQSSVNTLSNSLNILLTQMSSMVETGTVRVTQTATAGHLTTFRANVSVPSGYVLTGIRDIKITNASGNASIHYSLNQFAASDSAVQAWVYNDTSSDVSLNVDFEWTAVRTSFSLS